MKKEKRRVSVVLGALAISALPLLALAQSDLGGTSGSAGQAAGQAATTTGDISTAAYPADPAASPTSTSGASTIKITVGNLGPYLTDSQGKSLYLFKADSSGQSTCSGPCAQVWPPLTVPAGTQPSGTGDVQNALLGTITRPDGTTQVTYKKQPLYYYAPDTNPGDTKGQGINSFGNLWYLVKPDGSALQ